MLLTCSLSIVHVKWSLQTLNWSLEALSASQLRLVQGFEFDEDEFEFEFEDAISCPSSPSLTLRG